MNFFCWLPSIFFIIYSDKTKGDAALCSISYIIRKKLARFPPDIWGNPHPLSRARAYEKKDGIDCLLQQSTQLKLNSVVNYLFASALSAFSVRRTSISFVSPSRKILNFRCSPGFFLSRISFTSDDEDAF